MEALVYETMCGSRKLGEEVHIVVDGVPFAKLEAAGEAYQALAAEICETMSYDPTSDARPPKAIRVDRGARYEQECKRNISHVRKTIALNMRECVDKFELFQLVVKDGTPRAIQLAAELYGCRQFVLGVITGRLHLMEESAVTVIKREWEEAWDSAFGDLVGKILKMQD